MDAGRADGWDVLVKRSSTLSLLQPDGETMVIRAKTGDREGTRRTRSVLSCAGHVPAAARQWRSCKSGSSRVHPVSLQRTSKSSPHGQKESVEERGKAASARLRFRSLLTVPRQPPHRLSFHKTNFKVNKAPRTRPLQPLYHRSGVFFLPPPASSEPLHLHELPRAGFTGQVPEQSTRKLAGPQAKGEEESFTKAFRLWFYMIGTAEQHPSSGLTFHL